MVAGSCPSGPPGGPGRRPRLFVRFGVLSAIRPRFAGAPFLEGVARILPGILPGGPNSQSHSRYHDASAGLMRTVSRTGLWCGDSMGSIVKILVSV